MKVKIIKAATLIVGGFLFNVLSPAVFGGETNSVLDRLSVRFTPEIRSTYVSIGKLLEDRPMQTTNLRLAYDLGDFGRVGLRNWDVSSLSDRRHDVHRHAFYHTEIGPTWEYDWKFSDEWSLHNDLTASWTFYDGFDKAESNKSYWWCQIDQSLANPYLTPFYRLRRCIHGSEYLYCRIGVRHRFRIWSGLYCTPEVVIDGGDGHNQDRLFGKDRNGGTVGDGFYAISPRLEFGWTFSRNFTVFAYVEQYEVMGSARAVNGASTYRCAHNDWTHGGMGLRISF